MIFEALQERQLPELLALEAVANPFPWTEAHFRGELSAPHSHITLLRDDDGVLVGYAVFWIVTDESELLTIAVHPEHRRQGYGAALLGHALNTARSRDCRLMSLEVRRTNEAAVLLYERAGFRRVTVREHYYVADGEDAVVMHKAL